MQTKNLRLLFPAVVFMILLTFAVTFKINPIQAETGKGKDVFKVIMTIFGVDESKGDVVAIVTAKDEQAKVKLFNASGSEVVPLNASKCIIEYVATFPYFTVNTSAEYKACLARR